MLPAEVARNFLAVWGLSPYPQSPNDNGKLVAVTIRETWDEEDEFSKEAVREEEARNKWKNEEDKVGKKKGKVERKGIKNREKKSKQASKRKTLANVSKLPLTAKWEAEWVCTWQIESNHVTNKLWCWRNVGWYKVVYWLWSSNCIQGNHFSLALCIVNKPFLLPKRNLVFKTDLLSFVTHICKGLYIILFFFNCFCHRE